MGSSDMDLADILRYNVICCMSGRVVLVTIIVLRNRQSSEQKREDAAGQFCVEN